MKIDEITAGLSSKQLINMIDENFFEFVPTKRKLMRFTRILIDKYCEEQGVAPADIVTFANVSGIAANYNVNKFLIKINRGYTKSYEEIVDSKNYFFLFDYFESVLHELRHHLQNMGGKDVSPMLKSISRIERAVKAANYFESTSYSYHPLELDARHFAYTTLKKEPLLSPYAKCKLYAEEELEDRESELLHIVGILKDKYFRKIKYIARPREVLDACIKQIALKNGLKYTSKKQTIIDEQAELENNAKLDELISEEIAPEFYNETFGMGGNSAEEEARVISEAENFNEIYESHLIKSKRKKAEPVKREKPVEENNVSTEEASNQ